MASQSFAKCGAPKSAAPEHLAKLEKGPVRILCDEIGFPWDRRLERDDLFVAFVRELVAEVARLHQMQDVIHTKFGGKPPSAGAAEVLLLAEGMLAVKGRSALTGGAILVHHACDRLNPDDAYPTDHLIDMLSSCASAIRFGLEGPCASRHAAEACSHVWTHVYGVRLHDANTPDWERAWARGKLQAALLSLLPDQSADAVGDAAQVEQPIREES